MSSRISVRERAARALVKAAKAVRGRPQGPSRPHGRPSYVRSDRSRLFVSREDANSFQLYRDMRSAFPVLDVAITKLVRLAGAVQIVAEEEVKADLLTWMRGVRVNAAGQGFEAWAAITMDQMMQYGRSVGELVPNRSRTDIYGLMTLDPGTIEFRTVPEAPLSLDVVQWQGRGQVVIPRPVALIGIHNPQGDSPHGTSLFRSLPSVIEALSVIENATVQVWRRMGAPPFHINWAPPREFQDPDGTATERVLGELETGWTEAMTAREAGQVHDYFTAGPVTIDVIGNKNALFDIQQPFRAFAEQVIAATGLPSWMFGFSWSSTETLSTQQADLIVANIEAIRRGVMPAIGQVLNTRQEMRGKPRVELKWGEVNLRDLTEKARGAAWIEQGRARRIENARKMWELGFWDQDRAARDADPTLLGVARSMDTPPVEGPGENEGPVGLHPASDE